MALLLFDHKTFETIQVIEDDEHPSVLVENFSWLLKNLHNYDPTHKLADKHWSQLGRGKRRELRGDAALGLGYKYFTHSAYNEFSSDPKTLIKNKGIVQINTFGYPFNTEKWEVTAPWPVTDVGKKETYYGPGGEKSPGGDPYVCLITARFDLKNKKKTRCYVSCNCKDFKYSFLHDLKSHNYTDPKAEVPKKGSKVKADGSKLKEVPQTAGVCKHIYAVLKNFYSDFIAQEGGPVENPEMFTTEPEAPEEEMAPVFVSPKPTKLPKPPVTLVPPTPIPILPKKLVKPLTKTQLKQRASDAIRDALIDADKVIPSDQLVSYLDPRKLSRSKNAALRYHKYKFAVRVETPDGKAAIYYMNPNQANSVSGQKLLTIPGLSKKDSYYLLTPNDLHDLIERWTTPFSSTLDKQLERERKKGKSIMFYESSMQYSEEMEILNESSPILKSMLEFNFRNNHVSRT